MTTYFVSNAGSNTAPYDTEAKAATSIVTINALPWLATDLVKVSSTHTQTAGAAITLTFPTTPGLQVLSVTFDGSGTGGLAAGAVVNVGASNNAFILGAGFVYGYGITWNGGTNNNTSCDLTLGSTTLPYGHVWETCTLGTPSTNTGALLSIGAATANSLDDATIQLINCVISKGNNSTIQIGHGAIYATGLTFSGTAPTTCFAPLVSLNINMTVVASDLSGVAWANLVSATVGSAGALTFFQCKFRAAFTFVTGAFAGPGSYTVEAIDCNSGDVNYYYNKASWQGTITADNTAYLDASDGTTSISWLMTGNANTSFVYPLVSPPITFFNSTLSATTTTVEIVNPDTTFTDAQVWQETLAKITSGSPLGTWNRADRVADILTAGTNQAASSAVWTGTAGGSITQKLVSGSFTPAEVGQITVVVYVATNNDVLVSPKVLSGSAKQWMTLGGVYVNEQPASAGGGLAANPLGGYIG